MMSDVEATQDEMVKTICAAISDAADGLDTDEDSAASAWRALIRVVNNLAGPEGLARSIGDRFDRKSFVKACGFKLDDEGRLTTEI
jgi:hypothetical protein